MDLLNSSQGRKNVFFSFIINLIIHDFLLTFDHQGIKKFLFIAENEIIIKICEAWKRQVHECHKSRKSCSHRPSTRGFIGRSFFYAVRQARKGSCEPLNLLYWHFSPRWNIFLSVPSCVFAPMRPRRQTTVWGTLRADEKIIWRNSSTAFIYFVNHWQSWKTTMRSIYYSSSSSVDINYLTVNAVVQKANGFTDSFCVFKDD